MDTLPKVLLRQDLLLRAINSHTRRSNSTGLPQVLLPLRRATTPRRATTANHLPNKATTAVLPLLNKATTVATLLNPKLATTRHLPNLHTATHLQANHPTALLPQALQATHPQALATAHHLPDPPAHPMAVRPLAAHLSAPHPALCPAR